MKGHRTALNFQRYRSSFLKLEVSGMMYRGSTQKTNMSIHSATPIQDITFIIIVFSSANIFFITGAIYIYSHIGAYIF